MRDLARCAGALFCVALLAQPALAAPDRMDDSVPDAVPDQEGALAASYGYQALQLEGPLNSQDVAHQLFKLRYTFSPDTYGAISFGQHDLSGANGLISPVFDNADSGTSLGFDLGINLMNVPATQADKAKNIAWAAGSAFGIGISGNMYSLEKGAVSEDDTLLKAYLVYSTDLSEKLRAHTYFSSGRLTGDGYSGSLNRIGGGLDYTLTPGCKPLVLMANGVLDVYNFRQPSFNTSRITRFDFGLRYRVAEDWYASAGWTTANDGESDASGSGIFAGLNFVDEPPCCEPCLECPPAPPSETQPSTPAPQASAGDSIFNDGELAADTGERQLLMAQSKPQPQLAGRSTSSVQVPGNEMSAAQSAGELAEVGEPHQSSGAVTPGGIAIPGYMDPDAPATKESTQMARAPAGVGDTDSALLTIALSQTAADAVMYLRAGLGTRPASNPPMRSISAEREVGGGLEGDAGAQASWNTERSGQIPE